MKQREEGCVEADRGIAGMVRLVGLVGRKLLSLQSPQERAHNGSGNHWPGCERWRKRNR